MPPSTTCWPTAQIASTNPLERLNAEINRRTNVVGIFPNEAAIVRLVGAILLEQNDEGSVQRRYMPLETMKPSGNTVRLELGQRAERKIWFEGSFLMGKAMGRISSGEGLQCFGHSDWPL